MLSKTNHPAKSIAVKSVSKVYILGLTISLCGFYFGFTFTEFNNFFEYFMHGKFGHSIKETQYHSINANLNTFITLGGLFCVFTSSFLLQAFRLKTVVLATCLVHIMARALMLFANLECLYVCRFMIGYIICFNSFTCPMYIADLLPKRFIGFLGSCYVGFMSLGIIVAMFMKYPWTVPFWWIVVLIPAILDLFRAILLGFVFNLESTKSLLRDVSKEAIRSSRMSNFEKEIYLDLTEHERTETFDTDVAKEQMDIEKEMKNRLLGNESLKKQLYEMPEMQRYLHEFYFEEDYDSVIQGVLNNFENSYSKKKRSILKMMFDKSYKLQFFIAIVVNALNQLTGINAINFYSKIIFKQLHFQSAETLTILCGNFFC